ncbi:uncharacterized protein PFLUO_LOCUS2126 [Penicillium psychrofluorescens]|uniref:uncharacterized protein n=1 Tax=Penicillium psychrofluorescens TaxID=3158075 RepID=UPI003CCDD677
MDGPVQAGDLRKSDQARRESLSSQDSQTAKQFIDSQMRLEADAREILPYSFDSCTYALGPLRQSLFACQTCNPPPENPDDAYTPAGVCYSCSIACHGEHTLVELFNKRNFVCDCGTTRLPSTSPCTLRDDPKTGKKGARSQEPAASNTYNHNFRNRFCGCGEKYDPHQEKGTMFQCMGLGTVETGGCGEDWWHPECLIGLSRDWHKAEDGDETPLPPHFPAEDDFDQFLCFKCIDSNPWLKKYAGTPGFLPPVFKEGGLNKTPEANVTSADNTTSPAKPAEETNTKKRKAESDGPTDDEPTTKRTKDGQQSSTLTSIQEESGKQEKPPSPKHTLLPSSAPTSSFSLFLQEDFYDKLCRCADCFPNLALHPQLREEEETYEPPLSDDGEANGPGSTGTGSILERGEAALSNVDRVRAIEGAMVYNHLRDKVKEFLKPFAESGQAVSADDIKGYFEKLRGDEQGIQDAAGQVEALGGGDGQGDADGDNRREQNGKPDL